MTIQFFHEDRGGEGSGFAGHAGRPGQVGGSAPSGTSKTKGIEGLKKLQSKGWKPDMTIGEIRDTVGMRLTEKGITHHYGISLINEKGLDQYHVYVEKTWADQVQMPKQEFLGTTFNAEDAAELVMKNYQYYAHPFEFFK